MIGKLSKAFLMLLIFSSLIYSGYKDNLEEGAKEEPLILVEEWLLAGPAQIPLPVTLGEEVEFSLKNLFDLELLEPLRLWVEEGEEFDWSPQESLQWKANKTEEGKLNLPVDGSIPQVAFLACYLDSAGWQKTKIKLESNHLFKVYLDGVQTLTKDSASKSKTEEMSREAEIALCQGKHRLFIIAIWNPQGGGDWIIKASLKPAEEECLKISLTTERTITEDDIYNSLNLSNLSVSPDGKEVAYTAYLRNPRTKKGESWVEIRKVPGGEAERVLRDSQRLRNIRWSPDGKFLCAIVPGEESTSDLWLIERQTGQTVILLDDVKGLGNAIWSPTGGFIIYSVTEEPEDKDPKIQRLIEMQDRYPYSRYKTHLYLLMIDSRISRRLTTGPISASFSFFSSGNPMSPDGKRLVFVKREIDLGTRPYERQEFIVLDLARNEAKSIFVSHFVYESSSFSPDGKYIYFVGSQSAGNPGLNNEEENDLYLLNPDTGELRCLTDTFDPSVRRALWTEDGSLFLLCVDKSRVQLYKTDGIGKRFLRLNTGVDVIREFDVSADGSTIIFYGESQKNPPKIFALDAEKGSPQLVYSPDEKRWSRVDYGKIEDLSFKNSRGDTIEGWIYYPVDFDPAKKYPLIVYYYGGVFPTSRYFDRRFHQYAANGYFVYVLNPSGAIGYGREFANLHVNDWGEIVTQEIISGVKKVIQSRPFIDSRRIGAFGGSYGGFMTLSLGYKTDLFRTLISMYGVTNITSHWGGGYWGYWYCGFSAANSFPWNRKDIYVDRSPLFHADRINVPVLLLHGDADVNVRYLESEQMFTALKILRKEVELIRFKGEDHGIRGTDANRRLIPKIMLAWWDKYLKDQPDAWDHIWSKVSD